MRLSAARWKMFAACSLLPTCVARWRSAPPSVLINAMVMVNTVVLVRGYFGLDDRAAAIGLAAFGAGGIIAAIRRPVALPPGANAIMLGGGAAMSALLLMGSQLQSYPGMLAFWFALGACYDALPFADPAAAPAAERWRGEAGDLRRSLLDRLFVSVRRLSAGRMGWLGSRHQGGIHWSRHVCCIGWSSGRRLVASRRRRVRSYRAHELTE